MNFFSDNMVTPVTLHLLVELVLVIKVVLRAHREPASRIAWIVLILALPVAGILAYLLFGELDYLWRAADQDGDTIDILVQKRRNKLAANYRLCGVDYFGLTVPPIPLMPIW